MLSMLPFSTVITIGFLVAKRYILNFTIRPGFLGGYNWRKKNYKNKKLISGFLSDNRIAQAIAVEYIKKLWEVITIDQRLFLR
ncbi:MAG: hypothetical protein JWQ40_137 [Segetibacter sp.]|nr:hypothetical protein [Segetibacter sp.]